MLGEGRAPECDLVLLHRVHLLPLLRLLGLLRGRRLRLGRGDGLLLLLLGDLLQPLQALPVLGRLAMGDTVISRENDSNDSKITV